MREIKFRGKRIDNGEWVYGDLIENQGRFFIYHATSETTLKDEDNSIVVFAEEVNLGTVGQFTGQKDRNGKEIYEGDILRYMNNGIEESVVEYDCGEFNPLLALILTEVVDNGKIECEIIGNIHDNPELLEGK